MTWDTCTGADGFPLPAAVVGTALGIKPIIDLNSEGKLITHEKVRGKANVYTALARHLEEADNLDVVYITHAVPRKRQKNWQRSSGRTIRWERSGTVPLDRWWAATPAPEPLPLSFSAPVQMQNNIRCQRESIPKNRLKRRFFLLSPWTDWQDFQNCGILLIYRIVVPKPLGSCPAANRNGVTSC